LNILEILPTIREQLIKKHGALLSETGREAELKQAIAKELKSLKKDADPETVDEVAAYLIGLGPVDKLLKDPLVSEIMVNRYDEVFLERNGIIEKTDLSYPSEEDLRNVLDRIVQRCGRRINYSSPIVDARLPDGSRVNAVIPPASDNTVITIRRFVKLTFTTEDLIKTSFLTHEIAELLRILVEGKANILVCGATGCGKTTFLRWLAGFVPTSERLITIEDTKELALKHPHCISLEASDKAGIYELMINALRMRPDRIILGEVRGEEAFELLQAMGTGHEGSITTVHANFGKTEAIQRLVRAMLKVQGVTFEELEAMVAEVLDFIIFLKRFPDGSRRLVHITQVKSERGKPVFNDIYRYNRMKNQHIQLGVVTPELVERLQENLRGEMPKHPAISKPLEVVSAQ